MLFVLDIADLLHLICFNSYRVHLIQPIGCNINKCMCVSKVITGQKAVGYRCCRCWKYETNCASSVLRLKVAGSQCGDELKVTGSIAGEQPRRQMTGRRFFTVNTISNGNWLISRPGVSSLNFLHGKL